MLEMQTLRKNALLKSSIDILELQRLELRLSGVGNGRVKPRHTGFHQQGRRAIFHEYRSEPAVQGVTGFVFLLGASLNSAIEVTRRKSGRS